MKKIIPVLLFSITAMANSQILQGGKESMEDVVNIVNAGNTDNTQAEGSPYLSANFTPVKINNSNETKLVRFNVVDNVIEVMIDEGKTMKLKPSEKYVIQLLDGSKKVYETHTFLNDDGELDASFFEAVYASVKYGLFLKERIKLIPGKKTVGYQDKTPAKYLKINDVFYISNFEGQSPEVIEIPGNKKRFFKAFGDNSKAVENLIKKEKLNIGQLDDLIKILDIFEIQK